MVSPEFEAGRTLCPTLVHLLGSGSGSMLRVSNPAVCPCPSQAPFRTEEASEPRIVDGAVA
ncbi:hypothetical protein GCM10022261_05330 [Brevibacterium daeguense]|uniref:Uncharacterized protein n=1 Tax=Brevibacterium daeguense TaxID=909936 RepID=A0ABP8EGA3_9MICO